MSIIIINQTVLLRILIDLGSVFSEIMALKSFNCLISSFTDAPETDDPSELLLSSFSAIGYNSSLTVVLAIFYSSAIGSTER